MWQLIKIKKKKTEKETGKYDQDNEKKSISWNSPGNGWY